MQSFWLIQYVQILVFIWITMYKKTYDDSKMVCRFIEVVKLSSISHLYTDLFLYEYYPRTIIKSSSLTRRGSRYDTGYVFWQTDPSNQCRARSDAAESSVWSGSTLFATHLSYFVYMNGWANGIAQLLGYERLGVKVSKYLDYIRYIVQRRIESGVGGFDRTPIDSKFHIHAKFWMNLINLKYRIFPKYSHSCSLPYTYIIFRFHFARPMWWGRGIYICMRSSS